MQFQQWFNRILSASRKVSYVEMKCISNRLYLWWLLFDWKFRPYIGIRFIPIGQQQWEMSSMENAPTFLRRILCNWPIELSLAICIALILIHRQMAEATHIVLFNLIFHCFTSSCGFSLSVFNKKKHFSFILRSFHLTLTNKDDVGDYTHTHATPNARLILFD